MSINSNRNFAKWGKQFFVQNIPSGAREYKEQGYKYNLYLVSDDGRYRLVHDRITFDVPKFKTIKDAQRWVWFCSGEGDFIDTL